MRNLVIPALVLLPSLASLAHAAPDLRPWSDGSQAQSAVEAPATPAAARR